MVEDWLANAYEGMTRRQFLARMSAAGLGLAGFAVASGSVAGELITTPSDKLLIWEGKVDTGEFPVPAYEARPAAPGKYPAVIIVPEIFGLHEHMKDVARRFALEGFLAITFEPYAREGGVLGLPDIPAVRKVVDRVPDSRIMTDMDSIAAHIKKHDSFLTGRIGVTGFCRGGMYALIYAAHNPEIKAAVSWYGQIRPEIKEGIRASGPLDIASRINAPVLGLYGEADLGIPASDVKAMESALKSSDKTAEFIMYPGAPHAFFADYRPSYRPDAAKDAWGRCISWMKKYLA